MKFFAPLAGSLLSAMVYSGVAHAADSLHSVGEAFCKARLANDDVATRALLSPSLMKAINEAQARSDIIAKAAPDEKPPLGDGIPYQAFPDVPQGCEVGKVVEKQGLVEVIYRFPDTPDAGWTDRLKVIDEDGKPLIDDVIYVNVANGEPDLGLRKILWDAFDQ